MSYRGSKQASLEVSPGKRILGTFTNLDVGKSIQNANVLQLGLNRLEESLGFPRRRETKVSRLVYRHHYVVPYDKEMYSYAGNGLMGFYRKGLPPPLTSYLRRDRLAW